MPRISGFSWQVRPAEVGALPVDPDPARAERAARAMPSMTKIDVGTVRAAADGTEAEE